MWIPKIGTEIFWHWPGNAKPGEPGYFSPPPSTRFTGQGSIDNPKGYSSRYGGAPMLPDGSNVRAHLPVDADALPVLGAWMERAAADPKNPWGLELSQFTGDTLANQTLVYDFAATEIGPGGWAGFINGAGKAYAAPGQVGDWPVKVGDSTDPNHRTERKIMGPYGDFEKTVGGKTYYYKNTRLNRPSDPWYQSPTESRNMNPVVSSTMGQGSDVGGGQNPTGEKLSTGVKLIIANYSRDLPAEGEGGRYAAKLKNLVKELKSLVGMS